MRSAKSYLLFFLLFSTPMLWADQLDSLTRLLSTSQPSDKQAIHNQLGKQHYREGNYAAALENFSKALAIAQTLNDSLGVAKMYSNIGVIKDVVGNYAEAIESYQKSLSIYDKLNDKQGKESVLNNIGVVYEEMRAPEKALEYYFQALRLKQERGALASMASTYNNIAIIYEYFQEDSDSASYYYHLALNIAQELGDENNEALIYSNLGVIQLRKGEAEKSKQLFNKALQVFRKTGDTKNIASVLHYLGLAYYIQSEFNKALTLYLESLQLAEKSELRKLMAQLYKDLSKLYEKKGNYQQALEYNRKHEEINETLLNLEKIKQIHQLEISFEIEKREQEIGLLKKQTKINALEISRTRTVVYALIAIFVLTVVIIMLVYHRNRIKKEQQLLVLQTRLFRSQTSPHFIFNSLMSIQTFLLSNKVEKASEYLVDFAKLIRSILQHTRESFITLDKEIEVLQQYVKLEKLRFSDKFDYQFHIDVKEPEDILIPPMLAQPFIENAIIHGLVPATEKGLLKIEICENENTVSLLIEDNGVGRNITVPAGGNKSHKSMATEITNQRIKLIRRRFKKKIEMQITDLVDADNHPAGTRVLFMLEV